MADLIGTTLGKYSIVARLGRGGMASVYKAHQPSLDRYVALKVLHSHLSEEIDFVGRFEREAAAVARLSHPGVVKIYDFDADDGLYYMVMELVQGPTLEAETRVRQEKRQAFTLPQIVQVAASMARVVDYAHASGVIHRDLKPSNIMLTGEGQVVITDFGLAYIFGTSKFTMTGSTSGTPEYMSPEQAKGERGDERSDIYSLGVILYELATGHRPFSGETPFALIMSHVNEAPKPPTELNPDIPLALEGVILTAMAKDPAQRFHSAGEMAQALEGLLDQRELAQAPLTILAPAPEPEALTPSTRGTTTRSIRPYRGLFAFREEDAPFFFGREAFTERLLDTVSQTGLAAVVGPSGSGKSSVVFAGLIPRLREEANWVVVDFRPGSDPFHTLADELLFRLEPNIGHVDSMIETRKMAQSLSEGSLLLADVLQRILQSHRDAGRLLLVADQFEELYTLCPDPEVRRRFPAVLLQAFDSGSPPTGRQEGGTCALTLTLRADFMGQALADRPFAEALQKADIKLGPMTRGELAQVIERPAAHLGVTFEPGLVERILDDVGDEPGNLPLLEFALTLMWDRRAGRRLTHAAYEAIGRVEGALARYAEKVYARLSEGDKLRARRAFTQMVRPGEGTEDTRRLARRAELDDEDWSLVHLLADERLVVTGQDPSGQETVEVVHEALINGWRRLQDWMDAERDFRAWQERLRTGVRQWEASQRDEAVLLRGSVLAEAEKWLAAREMDLTPVEKDFIAAGVALRERRVAEREAQRQRELEAARKLAEAQQHRAEEQARAAQRLRKRAIWLAGALFVAAIFALLAAGFGRQSKLNEDRAEAQRQEAEVQRGEAETQRQTAEARRQTAVALQAEAEEQRGVAEAQRETAVVLQGVAEERRQEADAQRGTAEARRQEADEQREEAERQRRIALARQLAAQSTTMLAEQLDLAMLLSLEAYHIYDSAETRSSLLASLQQSPNLVTTLRGHQGQTQGVSFSPDGSFLASAGSDSTVRLWAIEYPPEGLPVVRPWGDPLLGHQEGEMVNGTAFSPDGALLASACDDRTVKVWDVATGEFLVTLDESTDYVQSVAFGVDGRTLYSSGGEPFVRVWDVATWQMLTTLEGHTQGIWHMCLSPDGGTLATGSEDGTIILWDLDTNHLRVEPIVPEKVARWIDFSPDGQILASVAVESQLIQLWDVNTGELLGEFEAVHDDWPKSLVFVDDETLATRSYKNIKRWNVATGQPVGELFREKHATLLAMAVSPDGRLLASSNYDGSITLWDLTGELWLGKSLPTTSTDIVRSVAFHPAGHTVAYGSYDGNIAFYDAASGEAQGEPLVHASPQVAGVSDLSLDLTGGRLVIARADGTYTLWDLESDQYSGLNRANVYGDTVVAHSADDAWVVNGGRDGRIMLWLANRSVALQIWAGHEGAVSALVPSPTAPFLISGGADGKLQLWRLEYGRGFFWQAEVWTYQDGVSSLAVSPDGRWLASSGQGGGLEIWSLEAIEQAGLALGGSNRGDFMLGQAPGAAPALDLAFLPDQDQRLLSVDAEGNVAQWDFTLDQARAGNNLSATLLLTGQMEVAVTSVAIHNQSVALGYADGSFQLWDLRSPAEPFLVDTGHGVAVTALALKEQWVVLGYADGLVRLWDLSSSAYPRDLLQEGSVPVSVMGVAYSPDGETLVSAGYNGTLMLWDTATGQLRRPPLTGHASSIPGLAFSPDGKLLASGSCGHRSVQKDCDQGEIILWDVASGELVTKTLGHEDYAMSVAFSPDGKTLASGGCANTEVGGSCTRGEIILWDGATGEPLGLSWDAHSNSVNSLALSPDGTLLASTSADGTVMLWDVATSQQFGQRMVTYRGELFVVAFSPDGSLLAVGGGGEFIGSQYVEGQVSLWDVATERQVGAPFIDHSREVYGLAFSSDGKRLISVDAGGGVMIWDVVLSSWLQRACHVANRNLTMGEWTQFFGDEPYRPTCPDLPAASGE